MKVKQWYKRRQAIRNATRKIQGAIDIVKDGSRWTKGTYSTADGQFCMVGALREAGAEDNDSLHKLGQPDYAVNRATFAAVEERGFSLRTVFNDAPNTTQEDVLDALERSKQLVPQYV